MDPLGGSHGSYTGHTLSCLCIHRLWHQKLTASTACADGGWKGDVVSALERMVVGLARESAFNVPLGGRILRSWRVIPVDQTGTGRGLKTFLSRLRGGDAVVMYPEGTRSPTGQIRAPQPGIGLIIIKTTAPVVPIKLFGAYEAYARHHWLPRPYQVQIKFGEPLDFADLRAEAKQIKDKERLKEIYQQAATDLLHAIAQIEPGPDQEE